MIGNINAENPKAFWNSCEQQLYAIAGADTTGYERVVLAVRALTNDLHHIISLEQLIASWPSAQEMLNKVADTEGFSTSELPKDKIAGAAFAMREREIIGQTQHQEQLDRLESARHSGEDWVLLSEFGSIDAGLFDPFSSTEMHVESGYAMVSTVQSNPGTGSPNYVLAVIKLDPVTGELIDMEPGVEDWQEHSSPEDLYKNQKIVRGKIVSVAMRSEP